MKSSTIQKVLLGLKCRRLRQHLGLSFAELSEQTGMAISYLNEIEKGKKYPKDDKIQLLAGALHTTPEELTSSELEPALAPLTDLLQSNFLNELPLDMFGIEQARVLELVAEAPTQVGAFIKTLLELARHYSLQQTHFYSRAVRAYQEMHYNYFEPLEQAAAELLAAEPTLHNAPVSVADWVAVAARRYDITVVPNGLDAYPALRRIKSVYVPAEKQLLLNGHLTAPQITFQIAKEIGYHALGYQQRAYTSTPLQIDTFEVALNNMRAAYFAVATLLPKVAFLTHIAYFFDLPTWQPQFLQHLLRLYEVSPETLFQRFGLAAHTLGIRQFYFVRVLQDIHSGEYEIDKELHLAKRHRPHATILAEHYCRRWIALRALQPHDQVPFGEQLHAQRARYADSAEEYLCLTIARPSYDPAEGKRISVTIGLLLNDAIREKLRFLDDPAIPTQIINVTCERCTLTDCQERAAPPIVVERRQHRQHILQTLRDLGAHPAT